MKIYMNKQKNNELISEILVSQEKQIHVDAIQMVEKNKVKDKEKTYEKVKKYLERQRKRKLSNR